MGTRQGQNKVLRYFIIDSRPENEAGVSLSGLSMYGPVENLIRQTAGISSLGKKGTGLRKAVLRAGRREEIDRRIAILQGKRHNEK
jgi:hypothetical protein